MNNAISYRITMADTAWQFVLPAAVFSDPDVGDTLEYMAVMADGTALPRVCA